MFIPTNLEHISLQKRGFDLSIEFNNLVQNFMKWMSDFIASLDFSPTLMFAFTFGLTMCIFAVITILIWCFIRFLTPDRNRKPLARITFDEPTLNIRIPNSHPYNNQNAQNPHGFRVITSSPMNTNFQELNQPINAKTRSLRSQHVKRSSKNFELSLPEDIGTGLCDRNSTLEDSITRWIQFQKDIKQFTPKIPVRDSLVRYPSSLFTVGEDDLYSTNPPATVFAAHSKNTPNKRISVLRQEYNKNTWEADNSQRSLRESWSDNRRESWTHNRRESLRNFIINRISVLDKPLKIQ